MLGITPTPIPMPSMQLFVKACEDFGLFKQLFTVLIEACYHIHAATFEGDPSL